MPEDCDSSSSIEASESASTVPRWLTVDIVAEAGDWSAFDPVENHVGAAADALAGHAKFTGYTTSEACVALSDDAGVRELNSTYRGIDKPTNVLSFPSGEGPRDGVIALGDIVLAAATLAREAAEQGTPPHQHLQHLVVHGLLHLLGFDHETEEEAGEMEILETEILASLNIANPYTEPPLSKAQQDLE